MWPDEAWLLDMLQAARRIFEYTSGLDYSDFLKSARDQDAVIRQLTILGEACGRVSAEFRTSHSEIPWRKVTAFRNVIVHDYFNVDLQRVWRIATEDVPTLISILEPLVPPPSQ